MITALVLASALSAQAAPSLPGPQPYPLTAEQRRREEQRAAAAAADRNPAPRIGVDASQRNSAGGGLVIGYSESLGGRWITEVYSRGAWASDPSTPVVLFVRRALDSFEAQEHVRWADSRTCPGMVEAMLQANDLPLPLMILPLDEASRIRSREAGFSTAPAPDGDAPHVFWAPARGPVAHSLQFSTYGGPWIDWARAVDRVLEPCWQNERPVAPSPDA